MTLPDELEHEFKQQLIDFEGERNMPYISTIERWSQDKGREEGRMEERRELVLGQLNAKVGNLSVRSREKVLALEFDSFACTIGDRPWRKQSYRLQALGFALLNFSTEQDLEDWFLAETQKA